MTDFDYDCAQKKRLAQGARHRKCGSKSRACSLPSDRMTQKQWKERNGVCMTMSLSKPMSWEDFKQLSAGMQTEYLQHITDTYRVGKAKIAKDMFKCSYETLTKYVDERGLQTRFYSVAGNKEKAYTKAWNDFLGVAATPSAKAEIVPEAGPESLVIPPKNKTAVRMDSVSLRFTGELDIQMVANSLRHIVGDGTRGTLTFMFCSKDVVAES